MAPREAMMPSLERVLYGGQISEGAEVERFEAEFGRFIGHTPVLSFYSGTAALHTALILAGVGPGDEVVSTPMTAEPTNLAIRYAGANVVWADVDPASGNIDPDSIAARITPRTRALMVVHYGGIPAAIERIRALAAPRGIPVIEDAAHALGARYDGAPLGRHSEYVMFSLQAIKHLTAVDGGMLALARAEEAARCRRIRWFGIDRRAPRAEVDVREVGYKYHMNNVNAAIGSVQLAHVAPAIARHIDNGRFFDHALQGIPGLETPRWDAKAEPSYWFYTVLAERRDDLARMLSERGIGNSLAHRRNDLHSVFASSRCDLPGLDRFYARMLHIPCGWWVSDEDRQYIAETLKRGW
ncbi:MAG: DegT/DnrJ/EryC1/StrS family aminotransferase [Betaproteobacteria bacterium]|nr:DegT/DnrJ/EryC1/StrS family aminotransferase [Betaproteobacteria bacterium]